MIDANVRMLMAMHAQRELGHEKAPACRFERAFASVFGDADEQPTKPVNPNQAQEDAGHSARDFE